jgi:hypothetical protein
MQNIFFKKNLQIILTQLFYNLSPNLQKGVRNIAFRNAYVFLWLPFSLHDEISGKSGCIMDFLLIWDTFRIIIFWLHAFFFTSGIVWYYTKGYSFVEAQTS